MLKIVIPKITQEAIILSKLTHQNIVRVFETNTFKKMKKVLFLFQWNLFQESISDLLKRK